MNIELWNIEIWIILKIILNFCKIKYYPKSSFTFIVDCVFDRLQSTIAYITGLWARIWVLLVYYTFILDYISVVKIIDNSHYRPLRQTLDSIIALSYYNLFCYCKLMVF